MNRKMFFICTLGALWGVLRVSGALPDDASAAAWLRGGAETYEGTPYTFLGTHDWTLHFDVKPQPGAALELLWGSKRDVRSAVIQIEIGRASCRERV